MGLFQKENQIGEKPKHNKTINIKIESLNGYDTVTEKPDENSTLTVKRQPVESV